MRSPFKIKFCGFRSAENAVAAVAAGADAIGLNFYAPSPRSVPVELAADIVKAIEDYDAQSDRRTKVVGLFVNADRTEIEETTRICNLDFIQLHGDETPGEFVGHHLPPLIKALSYRGQIDDLAIASWEQSQAETRLVAFLVDAHDPIQRGGTGKQVRWDLLSPRPSCFGDVPLILAGGLRPTNVDQAVELARPDAVDAASGVESAKGVKSVALMQAFVASYQTAQSSRI